MSGDNWSYISSKEKPRVKYFLTLALPESNSAPMSSWQIQYICIAHCFPKNSTHIRSLAMEGNQKGNLYVEKKIGSTVEVTARLLFYVEYHDM